MAMALADVDTCVKHDAFIRYQRGTRADIGPRPHATGFSASSAQDGSRLGPLVVAFTT